MNFAEYFRAQRKAQNLTMRKFANNKGYDVGYISRLEAGIVAPPAEKEKLEALAIALELTPATKEWVHFFDLAAASRAELPVDLKDNQKVLNMLPAFYRTLRKDKINEEEVTRLLQKLKGGDDDDTIQSDQALPALHDRGGPE